jgi:general secretion pathway protein G
MNLLQPSRPTRRRERGGYTLIEVTVVATILGILAAIPAPLFARAIEQSRLDLAASNLRAIWCAERYFYLENGRYGSLVELSGGTTALLDPSIASGTTFYAYTIDLSTGSFVATATHPAGQRGSGDLTIDQTGTLDCQVVFAASSGSVAMTPSLEPQ